MNGEVLLDEILFILSSPECFGVIEKFREP